jgi:hypothetical protein
MSAPALLMGEPRARWRIIRPSVGIAYLIAELVVLALAHLAAAQDARQLGAILESATFATLGFAAALLAYWSARSFGPGQTARRAWIFIAIMPLSDAIAYLAYTMPDYLGVQSKSGMLVGVATGLLSVTRILAAVAFFAIFRVYRRSGLRLNLRARDYLAMVLVTLMEVVALLFSSSGARASGGPELQKLVLITAIPMIVALVPCSVLGVVIWRYTTQMGGGLVAKAWRANLLYGIAWLGYIGSHALVAYFLRTPETKAAYSAASQFFLWTGADWTLKLAEYLIFLGASYQYEACTSAPDFSAELTALGAEV